LNAVILVWDCLSLKESYLANFIKEVIVRDYLRGDESWYKSFQARKYSFHSRGKVLGRDVSVLTFQLPSTGLLLLSFSLFLFGLITSP